MDFAIMLIFLFLLLIGCLFYYWLGRYAWRLFEASGQTQAEHSKTLLFLAINLSEPLINIPLIGYLFVATQGYGNDGYKPFITLPMAILVISIVGWSFRTPIMRTISRTIFILGILRWLSIFMTLSLPYIVNNDWASPLAAFGPFIAFCLLLYSYGYAKDKLNGPLQPVLPPLVPPAHMQKVIIQARTATPVEPERVPPLSYLNATPCPICHTLIWLEHSSCPACGLLLASRIPKELHVIPRYDVLRPLAGGGMSGVYLARDRAGGRLFALKTLALIDGEHSAHWYHEASACLQNEANLLRELHHPGLPAFEGWYTTSWGYFMATGYVPGLPLDQQLTHLDHQGQTIQGHALTPGQVAQLGAQVAATLHVLHSQPDSIIHCDIKPANLIAPEYSYPVLLDFGSAVVLHETTHLLTPGTRYGTPGYAAPEQYQGSIEPQSDVYALAATLYHLATDDDPSQHPLRFPKLTQLPQDLAEVLSSALQRDAWQRPDAASFAEQLRNLA